MSISRCHLFAKKSKKPEKFRGRPRPRHGQGGVKPPPCGGPRGSGALECGKPTAQFNNLTEASGIPYDTRQETLEALCQTLSDRDSLPQTHLRTHRLARGSSARPARHHSWPMCTTMPIDQECPPVCEMPCAKVAASPGTSSVFSLFLFGGGGKATS